jgi:hypothetical protein
MNEARLDAHQRFKGDVPVSPSATPEIGPACPNEVGMQIFSMPD